MEEKKLDELAKIIWDYHHLNHRLKKSDAIIVLGNHDIRVAEHGAELFLKNYAPILIFSGGKGVLTKNWKKPEAEIFAEIAISKGVPTEKILIENQSTNTSQNFLFTKDLLSKQGLEIKTAILVHEPHMERRLYATCKKNWPELKIVISSPQISYQNYPNQFIDKNQLINIMVGYLQRIKTYPPKGFQIPQKIPPIVWSAYQKLVKAGYTKHLIVNETA